MASYYDRLMDARTQWKKEKPCDTACCPQRSSRERCLGPCSEYACWSSVDPFEVAIEMAKKDIKRNRAEIKSAEERLIRLKEMKEQVLKP